MNTLKQAEEHVFDHACIFKLVIDIVLYGHATLSGETAVKRDTTLTNQISDTNYFRDLSAQGRPLVIFGEVEPRSRPSHLRTVTKLGQKIFLQPVLFLNLLFHYFFILRYMNDIPVPFPEPTRPLWNEIGWEGMKENSGLPHVRKWSGKKVFKVREIYFESGKIDI